MSDPVSRKVSVCVPVYNGGDYIGECIESILSQTYKEFSLIICDNCSTDNTEEIVHGFQDSRITYVRNPKNLGPVGNANLCLEVSDGEYVCIFHHDDVMLPDNLGQKVLLLEEHPDVGFVHSNLILIDTKGDVIERNIWNEDSRRDYIEKGINVFQRFLEYLPFGASIFIGTVLARRACYERLGGFKPELPHCNDSEMWMRMLLFYNAACIGTPLVKYRVHPTSASSHFGDYTSIDYIREHYDAATLIFDKYRDHIPRSESLKHRVNLSFGERAVHLACSALVTGDFAAGKTYLKEAVNFSPWIIKNVSSWKAAAGVAVGPDGIRLYQSLKKNLFER